MKINSAGTQAYQQILRPETGEAQTSPRASRSNVNDTRIGIEPQPAQAGSASAVQTRATFAARLSESEQTALELLFAKYQERNGASGAYGSQQVSEGSRTGIGLLVDVKG